MFLKQLKKNKNKGFTLVELIVTFALFSIIGIGAMVLLIETSNIFQSTTKLNNVQNATLIITDTIKAHMYGVEQAEVMDEMPSQADRGNVTLVDQPEKYGYLYFNTSTGMLEKAIGSQNALGISMSGVTGLSNERYDFEVYFYNSAEDDVINMTVSVYDQFSTDPYTPIYEYETSFYLHNLKYAADIEQQLNTEPSAPAGSEGEPGTPDTTVNNGHIGGIDTGYGIGGYCLKYRIAD